MKMVRELISIFPVELLRLTLSRTVASVSINAYNGTNVCRNYPFPRFPFEVPSFVITPKFRYKHMIFIV
jgi:hypothetical protein